MVEFENLKFKSIVALNPEIEGFVISKYREGYGYRSIANMLESEYKIKVSYQTIKRFVDKRLMQIGGDVNDISKFKEKSVDIFLDTVEQMRAANEELWNIINKLKSEGKNVEVIAALRELRKQVELQNKLLGKLQMGTQINVKQTNINTINLAMQINRYLEKLEEKGWIIVKQNLKHQDAIENFEEKVKKKVKEKEIISS